MQPSLDGLVAATLGTPWHQRSSTKKKKKVIWVEDPRTATSCHYCMFGERGWGTPRGQSLHLRRDVKEVIYLHHVGLVAQVFEEGALVHELRDDEDGFFESANGIQDQDVLVSQALHDLGFLEEVLDQHRPLLHGLHSHVRRVSPRAFGRIR